MSHHISIFVEWFGISCCIAESQVTRRQPALWLHQSTLLPSADRSLTSSIAPRDLTDPIGSKSHLLSCRLSQDKALFNTFHTLMFLDKMADRKNFSLTCHFPFEGKMLGVLNLLLSLQLHGTLPTSPTYASVSIHCSLEQSIYPLTARKEGLEYAKWVGMSVNIGCRWAYGITRYRCILASSALSSGYKKMSTVLSLGTMKCFFDTLEGFIFWWQHLPLATLGTSGLI